MKQLVILSGKGGTGKTTVAAALAHLASQELPLVLADADVDAANLELVLEPRKVEEHDFRSGKRAVIDEELCTACGMCHDVCRFDAIVPPGEAGGGRIDRLGHSYRVDALSCEGCAACFYQCPEDAITMEEQLAGKWFRSDSRFGPLFHAHLFAGQENSGKLVTLVKRQGRELASATGAQLLLVDGPPGIGCPVISASSGVDMALLVVEPTVSGVHDLERILATTEHFGVPALVIINKADLNVKRSDDVSAFCDERGVELVGQIPYDTTVTEAMVEGRPVTAYADGPVSQAVRDIWSRIKSRLALET
jgi:MinD superfamily P-loop ATPase